MEVTPSLQTWLPQKPSSVKYLRPPFLSSPLWGKTLYLHCKSRSVVFKRGTIIRGCLDSIFEDEFKKKRNQFDLDIDMEWRKEMLNMEQKANRVDIPFSIRIIKKKNQWRNGVIHVSESAYCSMKKAFSSMVFIIRELQRFSLQMREKQSYEIIHCVQKEMVDSFLWLFQQVFSRTPTLMVSLMILLANYSVYSMDMPSIAPATVAAAAEHRSFKKFDSSLVKSFSVSSTGKTISVGGSSGSGGKFRPVVRGADDSSSAKYYLQSVHFQEKETSMDEDLLWNSMVDEASRLQTELRGDGLDYETSRWFVAPVTAVLEEDGYENYFETEMMYQTSLAADPNNSLLLANFAQFLFLVARDFDRAEVFFKRATRIAPTDAEALSKYANFLWHARNDISGAEETYSAAVAASPSNSNYAAVYAHFLWATGGEEACNSSDQSSHLR